MPRIGRLLRGIFGDALLGTASTICGLAYFGAAIWLSVRVGTFWILGLAIAIPGVVITAAWTGDAWRNRGQGSRRVRVLRAAILGFVWLLWGVVAALGVAASTLISG